MRDNQKRRLERNLSMSASGAKPYWPRVLIGPEVEKQGYVDPKLLPLNNEKNLGEFYADFMDFLSHFDRKMNQIESQLTHLGDAIETIRQDVEDIDKRLEALEGFAID